MSQNELDITELSQEAFYILAAWKINPHQQANLLGISNLEQFLIYRNSTLPNTEEVLLRAQLLISIDRIICLSFPHAPQLGRLWITTPSPILSNRNPLEVMLEEGLAGIKQIHAVLNGVDF